MAQVVTKQVTSGVMSSRVNTGDRDWNTGLFDCFSDCGSMVYALCCFPCFLAHQSTRLGEHCCVGCHNPVALRTKLRLILGIQGTICKDCLVMGCFLPCAACQMSRELDASNM